jgi:hypothetical protein
MIDHPAVNQHHLPHFDLAAQPFSLSGAFLKLQVMPETGRLRYATSSRQAISEKWQDFWAHDFFEIAVFRDGVEIPILWEGHPHRVNGQGGNIALCIAGVDTETFLFELNSPCPVNLCFLPCKPYQSIYLPAEDQIAITDWAARGVHQFRVIPETGTCAWQAAGGVTFSSDPGASGTLCGAFRFTGYETRWDEALPTLADCIAHEETASAAWLVQQPAVRADHQPMAALAWLLMRNLRMPKVGPLTRSTIYSSKGYLNGVWAWDNCFHALAVASADSALAWDQLMLFFDHQNALGMIPDRLDDLFISYGFTKPPIYGWAIFKLVERLGLKSCRPYLAALYDPLRRLTEWWYSLRDSDHDGLCEYRHGNDSGWDNATVFDQGYPTEGADLAAFLTLQLEALAFIARDLGRPDEATLWASRAARQRYDLLVHSVRNGRFVSPLSGNHTVLESHSLLNRIPIILGNRLPPDLRTHLVNDLRPGGPFLTTWGLASEAPSSAKYEADGYWRGPIWAPSTYLLVDGLIGLGERALAREIAERFCSLCIQAGGFWENFDALSGAGLRCQGVAWTAAAFLLLAEWLNKPNL